ncbi:hypothetical protein [Fulvivirga ligni]|uniref:hypothetical protein n=1 Tax=Fulvivirga ligni TaxID=2904246 RepID=UPI001F341DC7|nr:hypothetical protein [Fulvivirga ligni]UII19668.1 hypothetical protein LVD16_17650 [Fulvivirga ligni]
MKKLSILVCAAMFFFTACEDSQKEEMQSVNTLEKQETNARVATQSSVPQEVVDAAIAAYGDDELPAMTIAFTYTRGDVNISLEEDWVLNVYSTPEGCTITEGDGRRYYPGYMETSNGFFFIEEDDLCGEGLYEFDNRQGGWFDYVCGPHGVTVDYQGESVIKLVRLWCE